MTLMTLKNIFLVMIIIVGLGVIAIGGFYGYERWQESRPTRATFNKVVKAIWEEQYVERSRDRHGVSQATRCIEVPMFPTPDANSKAQAPLAWHMDFISEETPAESRVKQLRQLDALVKVGFLKKTATEIGRDGVSKRGTRYSLTELGWAASAEGRRSTCFVYGTIRFLDVTGFEPKIVSDRAGLKMYQVRARAGFGDATELQSWARDPEFQSAFPEIGKSLKGQDFQFLLVRGSGTWADYHEMQREQMLKKDYERITGSQFPKPSKIPETPERKSSARLPLPTEEEIRRLLQATHGVGQSNPWPLPCLSLPGSEKLPVDKSRVHGYPSGYAVAVFTNKQRGKYDRVVSKTMPELDRLERLGVLVKRFEKGIPGEGKDANALFDGYIYALASAYESRISSSHAHCFPLGEPTVEFVSLKIDNDAEYATSSFSYRLRVSYKNPPPWMQDAALLNNWPELRGAVKDGLACEGEFGFDRETRDKYGGGGSCWWAFDSYYENY